MTRPNFLTRASHREWRALTSDNRRAVTAYLSARGLLAIDAAPITIAGREALPPPGIRARHIRLIPDAGRIRWVAILLGRNIGFGRIAWDETERVEVPNWDYTGKPRARAVHEQAGLSL